MRIRSQCRECGLPFSTALEAGQEHVECPGCAASRPLDWTQYDASEPHTVSTCLICGCRHLYRQRDVNRALGCLVVVVAILAAPWTWGLSLLVAAAIDWWLWFRLKERPVCYRCDTVYRDARPTDRQKEFDLLRHDVLKYGKSWETVD